MGSGQADERNAHFYNDLDCRGGDGVVHPVSRHVLRNGDPAGAPLGLQRPHTAEVAYREPLAKVAAQLLSGTEGGRFGEHYQPRRRANRDLSGTRTARNPLGNAFPNLTLGNCHGIGLAAGAVTRIASSAGVSFAGGSQNALGQELSPLYGKYAKNVGRSFGICGYNTGRQGIQPRRDPNRASSWWYARLYPLGEAEYVQRYRTDDTHNDVSGGRYRDDDACRSMADEFGRTDRDTFHPCPDTGRTVLVRLC